MVIIMLPVILAASLLAATASGAPSSRLCAKTYDYIVVGGGTAGLALSTRLSQGLPNATVLVIEAGPAGLGDERIEIPGRRGSTFGSAYDWNLTTVPQAGSNGRVWTQTRGHVLGGSSALNLFSYDRASAHEYDGWEELGNPGWNWNSMRDAMIKSENFTSANTEYYTGSEGVGDSGPIKALINRLIPEHQAPLFPVMNSLGIETNLESLNGNVLGVLYSPNSIEPTHYNRSYSANSYLPLASTNHYVLTESKVAKVNLEPAPEGGNRRATGVTLLNGRVLLARREVIVSGGSLLSPAILENSGIGKADVLSAAGIEQLVDLPGVGENLQDHVRIQSSYELKENFTGYDRLKYDTAYAAEQLRLWWEGKTSMYGYSGSGYTFTNWNQALGDEGEADLIALARDAVGASSHPVERKKLEWLNDTSVPQLEILFSDGYTGVKGYPTSGSAGYGKDYFTLIAAVMHPLSRGNVHINPANPLGPPLIDPKYLSHEYDLHAAIQAIKKCRQVALTEPLRSTWVSEYEPGLNTTSDAQWREFALKTTLSIYHPVGTCAMLPKADDGVVDPSLKVYGTTNLRVVDASIMPVLISAHIQTAVYGIAERAAEIIIQEATT
ncbi:choline dehydrogenase [Colletotrichum higginsianum]|uniref:Choline dehydrogenase n=2 Tax=Colletotrichum higginsianum TaxID=80884 RepID=H1V7I4_COLHI|nr:Choline dehydrogenase [Colletotrichum higginsianum IMI 349063]OBR09808.1 Choline dehydrogenase [Colletotrichum higginsianum IMI 349063]CCF36186.1 choline dehydrogenase [Colletotrichum higginsianum]